MRLLLLYLWHDLDARVLRWLYAPRDTWRVHRRVADMRRRLEEAWR